MKMERSVKYCPITGNQPMRCTKAGFLASCKKFRAKAADKKFLRPAAGGAKSNVDYCLECGGQIPEQVTFIDLIIKNKEIRKMPTNKMTMGICNSCGAKKKVKPHLGKIVCGSCMPIMTAAKTHPEMTITALREFGHLPLPDEASKLPSDKAELLKEISALLTEVDDLNKIIDTLKEQIRVPSPAPAALDESARRKINDLAWRLADGVMDGQIIGIVAEDIRTLRDII